MLTVRVHLSFTSSPTRRSSRSVCRVEAAVRQRAAALDRDQSLYEIELAAFLEDPDHVMPHDPRLRVGRDDGATEPLDEQREIDRKSTRLNSSHLVISYAVFCLK